MAHTLPPFACDVVVNGHGCELNHALMPENYLAWRVFEDCMSQLRLSGDRDVLGIEHAALWKRIEAETCLRQVPLKVFHKVLVCEAEMVSVMKAKRKVADKREEQKEKSERRRQGRGRGYVRGRRY